MCTHSEPRLLASDAQDITIYFNTFSARLLDYRVTLMNPIGLLASGKQGSMQNQGLWTVATLDFPLQW